MGENHFAPLPTAVMVGAVAGGRRVHNLQTLIVAQQGENSRLAAAVGSDFKAKLSLLL